MSRRSIPKDFIDLLADCVLIAYLDHGRSADNQTLVRYVLKMIEGERVIQRFKLAGFLTEARKRLRTQDLNERVKISGRNAPGVWRLTNRGKDRAI